MSQTNVPAFLPVICHFLFAVSGLFFLRFDLRIEKVKKQQLCKIACNSTSCGSSSFLLYLRWHCEMRREDKEKKPQTNAKDWWYGLKMVLLEASLGGAAAKWSLVIVWVTLMQSPQHVHPAEAQVKEFTSVTIISCSHLSGVMER